MLRHYDAYLFDLDGTLVDTAPDLGQALNASLRDAGFPGVTTDQARQWIGFGARYSLTQAIEHHQLALTESATDQLLEGFLNFYAAHVADASTPYDSVIDTLDVLHDAGAKLAVVTNKPARFTVPLLSALSLDGYFESVISGDTATQPKPAADPILLCLDELNVGIDQALMVGDSLADVGAAKAAGVDVACFRHGYNHGMDVRAMEPNFVFDRLCEILPIS
ncbi:MAG TPA: phosphoglycolate phosphatase, partial [Gammaproteobacteria bacterium]|jgi:phosphoglycolate phosphatase|nr:phosphoglycolate phosphatase [Gammaproteobacteria bacterium]|tara:strand:+ start:5187 stop:5849 length:663 start_codon:yes stop_codon:yes gene_type:complete